MLSRLIYVLDTAYSLTTMRNHFFCPQISSALPPRVTRVPPGLDEAKALVFTQGGEEHEWRSYKDARLYTNAFVMEGNKVHPHASFADPSLTQPCS